MHWKVYINGEYDCSMPAHHVESRVFELELEFESVDEYWDNDTMTVYLTVE
jgi:hypothetical protein